MWCNVKTKSLNKLTEVKFKFKVKYSFKQILESAECFIHLLNV